MVQAFISCRLDYCNSLFYGITEGLMSRLQSVQNATARLVSGARRYDLRPHHATGVALASGWTSGGFQDGHPGLPVHGMAPAYLAADCQLVSNEGSRQLRSATSMTVCECEADLQQLRREMHLFRLSYPDLVL